MIEILNFKFESNTYKKLKTSVTNLNVQGLLILHCGRPKNAEYSIYILNCFTTTLPFDDVNGKVVPALN
jgi:hypothetical protein